MKTETAILVAFLLGGFVSALAQSPPGEKWVVHEWGTFTSLQDEEGRAFAGINTDDEPVPEFVHRMAQMLLITPTEVPTFLFQGAPHCHPDVTMRLETPVIYFHPPLTATNGQKINVRVKFKGGWLSEFYPDAEVDVPGLGAKDQFGINGLVTRSGAIDPRRLFNELKSDTVSMLTWNGLEVGGNWPGPQTDFHVWNSPRQVAAAALRTTNGESDKFLFYRGVAHINAPLKISTRGENLIVHKQLEKDSGTNGPMNIKSLWLVDIRPKGTLAYRPLPPLTLTPNNDKRLAMIRKDFEKADYDSRNLEKLKTSLRTALVAEGLFEDEAQALLNTWELSYFKSAGLRVFFIVPRTWTDSYLPLDISVPAEISRVMVGRIELVTSEQREILKQIGQLPIKQTTNDAFHFRVALYDAIIPANEASKGSHEKFLQTPIGKAWRGRASLMKAGVSVPQSYQLYLNLGRFRDALILDEAAKHPTPGLTNFVSAYAIYGYKAFSSTHSN